MFTSSPTLLAEASDAELISRTRAGSDDAYAELFTRHRGIALGVARKVAGADHADDLVAEAFMKVLAALQSGGGPDDAFRGYLLTTVRNVHLNKIRATRRESLVPDYEDVQRNLVIQDGVDDLLDGHAASRAFAALPERWQTVLWLGAVEGRANDEIAQMLDLKPNAVAALSFRAREGLREAYLADHLLDVEEPSCRKITDLVPAYVRGNLTGPRHRLVVSHLDGCARCARVVAELQEVESNLAAFLAPLLFIPLVGQTPASTGAVSTVLGWFANLGAIGKAAVLAVTVGPLLTATVVAGNAQPSTDQPGADRPSLSETVAPLGDTTVDLLAHSTAERPPLSGVDAAQQEAVVAETPGKADQVDGAVDEGPDAATEGGAAAVAAPVRPQAGGSSTTAEPTGTTTPTSLGTLVQHLLNGVIRIPVPVVGATAGNIMKVTLTGSPGSPLGVVSGGGWACSLAGPDRYDAQSWSRSFACGYLGTGGDPVVIGGSGLREVEVALSLVKSAGADSVLSATLSLI